MTKLTRRGFIAAGATVAALPTFRTASAQAAWPSKPIRIVVAYPPGGQTDLLARAFGNFLSQQLGQPVVVENKGGGAGIIGVTEVKRAAPDGYTLLCTISASLIQNRATVKDLPYEPEKDFVYLTTVSSIGGPFVVAEKTGVNNLKEFVEYAKKTQKMNFGAYGVGSFPHLYIEALNRQYGLTAETVHYRGEAPMWADVSGQSLDAAAGSYAAASPVLQSGRGKLIAVWGDRLQPHPDVPTLVEQGAKDKIFDVRAFAAFAAPAGTPPEIVKKLSDLLVAAGEDSKVKQVLTSFMLNPPDKFEAANARFKADTQVILGLLKELNVKPE